MQSELNTITIAAEKIYSQEDDLCSEKEFNDMTDENMKDSAAQFSMENGTYIKCQ